MRIIVLAASNYSDRALATIVSLCEAGYAPVACLSISTTSFLNLARKVAQYGAGNFFKYAAKRVGLLSGSTQSGADMQSFDNRHLAIRLRTAGLNLSNVQAACRHYKLKLHYTNDVNGDKALLLLREFSPDLIVYTGGGILRRPLIETPTIGVINAHSGLLPEYRGMNVTEWALINGDAIGITVHFIDPGIDTGRILFRKPMHITPEDLSINALRERVSDATVDALVEAVEMLAKGAVTPINQEPGNNRQYFVMHEKLLEVAERRLSAAISSVDA
jgi:folate-dependent phosphoribosylglycinamide formyltransferase PurN